MPDDPAFAPSPSAPSAFAPSASGTTTPADQKIASGIGGSALLFGLANFVFGLLGIFVLLVSPQTAALGQALQQASAQAATAAADNGLEAVGTFRFPPALVWLLDQSAALTWATTVFSAALAVAGWGLMKRRTWSRWPMVGFTVVFIVAHLWLAGIAWDMFPSASSTATEAVAARQAAQEIGIGLISDPPMQFVRWALVLLIGVVANVPFGLILAWLLRRRTETLLAPPTNL